MRYKSMVFINDDPFNPKLTRVESIRLNGFKSLEAAKRAVLKYGKGYIIPSNSSTPIWNNTL